MATMTVSVTDPCTPQDAVESDAQQLRELG
jgi:hypothetical protein